MQYPAFRGINIVFYGQYKLFYILVLFFILRDFQTIDKIFSNVHKFEKFKNVSINIFELNFYQGHNKWRHKQIPNIVLKNDSARVIDLIIYKNH